MAIATNVHKSQMAEICIGGNCVNCEQVRFVDNAKFTPLDADGKRAVYKWRLSNQTVSNPSVRKVR